MNNQNLIFLKDWTILVKSLPKNKQSEFWSLFLAFADDEIITGDISPEVLPIWNFIKKQIEKMQEKYLKKIEKKSIAGTISGKIRQKNKKIIPEKTPKPKKRFVAPKFQEVLDFAKTKKLDFDFDEKKESENFINFYNSKNWIVGKNKMVSWQSAFAGWIGRKYEKKKSIFDENKEHKNFAKLSEFFGKIGLNQKQIDKIFRKHEFLKILNVWKYQAEKSGSWQKINPQIFIKNLENE